MPLVPVTLVVGYGTGSQLPWMPPTVIAAVAFDLATALVSPAGAGKASIVSLPAGPTSDGVQERPSKSSSVASRRYTA